MKKLLLLFISLGLFLASNAQLGGIAGGVAQGVLGSQKPAKLKKHWMFNLDMSYPVSITRVATGSESGIVLPPLYFSAEYGVQQSWTIGGMIGFGTSKAKSSVDQISDIIGTISGLFGGNPTPSLTDEVEFNYSYTLIGVCFKNHFVGGPKTNMFIANRSGLRINGKGSEVTTNITNNGTVDDLIGGLVDSAPDFFSSFSIGANFFMDKDLKWAISPELGYGLGWGDGFSIAGNPMLITIGATYHIKPKNAAVEEFK